jgi:hypothetical protein
MNGKLDWLSWTSGQKAGKEMFYMFSGQDVRSSLSKSLHTVSTYVSLLSQAFWRMDTYLRQNIGIDVQG